MDRFPPGRCIVRSDIEEPHILCVALDELAPRLDVLAHQHGEQPSSAWAAIVEGHLHSTWSPDPSSSPTTGGVHLPGPCSAGMDSLGRRLPAASPASTRHRAPDRKGIPGGDFDHLILYSGGHGRVDVSGLEQGPHESEEQGEQQGPDVLAVDVGVGHQDEFVGSAN